VRQKTTLIYLLAKRENRLFINLLDVENPMYITKEIMDEALRFIAQNMEYRSDSSDSGIGIY
jgi:hypothetical protein